MSRRKRPNFGANRRSTFALNITSMTDMFTIMLVFLLQTFATADVQVEPVQGMRLPSSNSNLNPIEGVRLIVTKDELLIGEHKLATLKDKKFDIHDIDGADANFLPLLFNELDKLAKNSTDEHIKEGRILLQADASLPYDTLRKVLYTASMAGFPQLKMVAMLGN
ncbi:MAG TPA: biopolymer transporter ExbD [Pseudobdellovibrionaceae bacterium]|nr:biopolymer transporter ExbD [Pseudobdellovibrionaceae bacterium]